MCRLRQGKKKAHVSDNCHTKKAHLYITVVQLSIDSGPMIEIPQLVNPGERIARLRLMQELKSTRHETP